MTRPRPRDFLAGGFLGNAPSVLLYLLLYPTHSSPIDFVSMLGGAVLAGFLMAKLLSSQDVSSVVRIGVLTGLSCYILNFLISLILLPKILQDYVILGVFVGGSTMGSLIRSRIRLRRELY